MDPLTDQEYANLVREAARVLERAVRQAQDTGLTVKINVNELLFAIGREEAYVEIVAKVWRPV